MTRHQCPQCGKVFDVEEDFGDEGLICPYCSAEIDT